jgi:RimJ/RimL family protein N-acetyltransferase
VISLETDRLILRNFCPEDWQDLQEVAIAYQASEWARFEDPWPTETEKVKGMAGWFANGDEFLAVVLKETDKLIGLIAINRRQEQEGSIRNLGYVFHTDYSGKGYATEGCQAAMSYLFDHLGIDGILTGTHPENEPSVRLLGRLGLKALDRGEYAISREEWLAREK